MKRTLLAALAVLFAAPAAADSLPGMRGVNHIGLTVPDKAEAVAFFEDVLGCSKATSFGPFRDDNGTFIQDLLNVHPRSVVNEITLIRCGNGANIELFDYDAPDQQTVLPKNSDIGGHHIAFYVDDINAAAEYLKSKGVRTLLGPLPVEEGPAAGQSIIYFFAPWGLQLEAISYPNGMAYEADAETILWSNTDPGN
ncbi:MAG: VOC family protein [Pseudomonadota bacterium]